MYSKTPYINEKSPNINIKHIISTDIKINGSPTAEYSLKRTFFDPSKSSPPNDFMLKLQMRMNMYNKATRQT
jgi:hypothetical protein